MKQKVYSLLSEHVCISVNEVKHFHNFQSLLKSLAVLIGGGLVEALNSELVLYQALNKIVDT